MTNPNHGVLNIHNDNHGVLDDDDNNNSVLDNDNDNDNPPVHNDDAMTQGRTLTRQDFQSS